MSGRFWLISILSLVAMVLVGLKFVVPKNLPDKSDEDYMLMKVGEVQLWVLVADEAAEMEQGLGGRAGLEENQGMLFIYPQPVVPKYWMKGMQFDLDFIWMAQGKVVEITERVPAPSQGEGQLPFYSPAEPVDGVLEVRAGWVEKNQIKVGAEAKLAR